jgi:hypothetical protein
MHNKPGRPLGAASNDCTKLLLSVGAQAEVVTHDGELYDGVTKAYSRGLDGKRRTLGARHLTG